MSTCKQCNAILPERKYTTLTFCSRSCAAKFNNTNRKSGKLCVVCGNHVPSRRKECCSSKCRDVHYFDTHTNPRIERGEVSDRKTLRKYIIRHRGYACECCGMSSWQEVRLPLELDHIDGDATHNLPHNLRLLCPNCHSITPTWKSKNKGNGRQSRGLRSS